MTTSGRSTRNNNNTLELPAQRVAMKYFSAKTTHARTLPRPAQLFVCLTKRSERITEQNVWCITIIDRVTV